MPIRASLWNSQKWRHGAHYLLCKGIEKATGELGLSFLAYNLKRAINLVGTKKLVEAMGGLISFFVGFKTIIAGKKRLKDHYKYLENPLK